MPPLMSIVLMIMAFGFTPAARAAAGFAPVARRSKPKRVRQTTK